MRLFIAVFLFAFSLYGQRIPNRYLVEFQEEPVATAIAKRGGDRTAGRERAAVMANEHRRHERSLRQRGARVRHSLRVVMNAMSVDADETQARRIAAMPGVRKVYPVYQVYPVLNRALALHDVPGFWNLIGGSERAGLGVKIGIIDTGVDASHPAMQDPTLQPPQGYPLVNTPADLVHTNSKVIVARSYGPLYGMPLTPADTQGHGTSVAAAAAASVVNSPYGVLAGVAPKAFIGNYKVFRDTTSGAASDVVLKGFDDAVADGMDVINLSLGTVFALRPLDDMFTAAAERASAIGVIVVAAAGNEGSDPSTISSNAMSPSVIAVGSIENDRTAAVLVEGRDPIRAFPGTGPFPSELVTGVLTWVGTLQNDDLACLPFPAGSLQDRIALIQRGTCLFEEKLNNVQAAGARGAILYTRPDAPEPFTPSVGAATLPSVMIDNATGAALSVDARTNTITATIDFQYRGFSSILLSTFSSRGPGADYAIKPDLVAVGGLLAVPGAANRGPWSILSGTSFSSPIVAGAAAALKSARPGLSSRHYRSLIINSATPVLANGMIANVQFAGAGNLNLLQALRSTVTAYPASLGFGVAERAPVTTRNLTVSNLGDVPDTYSISVEPQQGPGPVLSSLSLSLNPRRSGIVQVTFPTDGLAAGQYQGFLVIRGTQSDVPARVPYWYAVASNVAAYLTILDSEESGTAGRTIASAIEFRVTDAAGIPLTNIQPTVTVVSGGGSVVRVVSQDEMVPGVWAVTVTLGATPGNNVFRVRVGDLERQVTIRGN
jgi:minor extracellular serine protease Vpr